MTVSRGRRSRESRKVPFEKVKDSRKISTGQKKFLRKLLYVLADIVDEKGHFIDDDETGLAKSEGTGSEGEAEDKKDIKEKVAHGRLSRQGIKENERMEVGNELTNITHFRKLCENHGQLTFQIRSALNALGGGGRTAKALEVMHNTITQIKGSFFITHKTTYLYPSDCMQALNAFSKAASEVTKAFVELGVYNTGFFEKLKRMERQLEIVAMKLDVEFGFFIRCPVDGYLDYVFEPLYSDFKDFLQELTNIAEKEIATIRQTQEFSSQRYLNLTTVATFLSSVTATTLQITANNSVSTLATVTNTLWFISLVFSTASAVYSLLVMTWRQSSVRQPDLSLPSLANAWLRNGPMYALITAVMTFSIGLCLLAFQIADQQGGLASAVVPTAFAGVHAYAIFFVSAWFLLEQWKARHTESWVKARDGYLMPMAETAKANADKIRDYGSQVKRRLKKLYAPFTVKDLRITQTTRAVERASVDVELGQNSGIDPPAAVASENPAQLPPEQRNEAYRTAEAAEPGSALAASEGISALPQSFLTSNKSAEDSEEMPGASYKPFENLLQFSPAGRFLASGFSDRMTIYDVQKSFSVLGTFKIPDADPVKQIAWNPNKPINRDYPRMLPRYISEDSELLVRSSRRVSVWNVDDSRNPQVHLVAQLDEIVGSVRWITNEDAGVTCFACAVNTSVKVFDSNCKEIRTFDLSEIRAIDRITDTAFFHKKYILCLADVPGEYGRETRLLVFNMDEIAIERYTSMIISQVAGMILFHGSNSAVEVVELHTSNDVNLSIAKFYLLWGSTLISAALAPPEGAVTFHGEDDKVIIGVSDGEIAALCRLPSESYYLALHSFTTPTAKAIVHNPVSFAVGSHTGFLSYMFAFGGRDGSVKIWSVQSNDQLLKNDSAEDFEVHDRRRGRSNEPSVSMGRFLTLPLPVVSE